MTPPLRTVCALVAYDGTDFYGFQSQADVPTVQDALEQALDRFCLREGRIIGAGRTDRGVHASGQVIRASMRWKQAMADLERAWNAHLPPSIAVRCVREAPEGFHPRFDAISRMYRYFVWWQQAPEGFPSLRRSPLTDRFALLETRPLDVAAMNQAASYFLGVHDFATFGQAPQEGEGTERCVTAAFWRIEEPGASLSAPHPARRLVFTIVANAFLRQMVRTIVGTLLAVGRGEIPAEAIKQMLGARDRSEAAPPAPPQGLMLERVTYPPVLDGWVHAQVESKVAPQREDRVIDREQGRENAYAKQRRGFGKP
ncbi:MAG: tRNA pseudouridine(38-40) synthase TruA [Caldilinea sp.]|nr:tRNA pseudouridine(38-40) synthase TruA [Caldilinea sp.]MDW8439015.1 tRNA pseudouridine(38-40) synthase TruA [Caldilineaceae bacterium]